MSFLYRIAVSAPSITTSGIRRPHKMPPQNFREPPSCCTCWTACLRRSVWPDCLQTRLWWLSGWRHMRHSSANRTWCQFWRVHSACFWAHLYHAAWCLGVKCRLCHGHQEWSCTSCSAFESNHDVLWLHKKLYSAWWHCFQGSSELKSVSSVINCSSSLWAAWATHVIDSSCISVPPHVRTTSLCFILRRLETSLDESPSWHTVTMQTRSKVAVDLLGMAELQKTREVYLLPDGVTGTDRLSYPLCHIGTAHVCLFTSLCKFSDIDEQSKGLCYWCNINIQHQCSGDLGTEVMQNFFLCVHNLEIDQNLHSYARATKNTML